MAAIEGSVSSLQGISTGARDAWLLAEAEYYMQIANAQLQLAGNPHLASLALALADERLIQLANPALTDIRRALSLELRSLDVIEKPDTEGVTLTLASLAAVVDSLPLKREVALSDADEEVALDPELTGVDRALASMKSAIDSAISVRRVDETVQPLIAPESQYFLRANLALQLQAARLAVLRGEETIFRQSLNDAASWLTEYFDTDSAAVRSSLQTIAEIHDSVFSVATPDISESLRLLRQFAAFSNATAVPVAEPSPEPVAEPEQ
jgi:uroporphyrin-3 C-methyltransferase